METEEDPTQDEEDPFALREWAGAKAYIDQANLSKLF
jgi:hypothetical protein